MGTRVGLNLVALFGILAQPIIPDAAAKILDALNIPDDNRTWTFGDGPEGIAKIIDALPHGATISAPDVLFTKIEDDDVAQWSEQFGGESP